MTFIISISFSGWFHSKKSYFKEQAKIKNTYFAESGDKIRGFYEDNAIDETNGRALNKVGHALHVFNPTFKKHTLNDRIREVISKVTTIKSPTVIQSMVIFKHPKVGGAVKPHQDATYLYTTPVAGRLVGFWIPLDEATTENGCLYFVPGSHKPGQVYERFVKNADKDSDTLLVHRGDPCPYEADKAIAAPVKPGDLVLIDGLVVHQSEHNSSNKPRLAYTFHVVDGDAEWSQENWLQPTEVGTFVKM